MRLIGFEAIEFAERAGLTLNKLEDAVDSAAVGLAVPEAEAIAVDRPELIWLEVGDDEYYGLPKNFQPGAKPAPRPKLAGQRPDELLPGQSGEGTVDRFGIAAAGTASAAGAGEADEELLSAALASGEHDHAADRQDADPSEPQSGFSGGAVGGTPANKRSSAR